VSVRALLIYAHGARLIEAQDIAGLKCDLRLEIANFLPAELHTSLLDETPDVAARLR
jgi:hypothetical protein